MAADKKRMGDRHEAFLADLNGGRQTRGSGNQAADRNDGRNHPLTDVFPFSWDGKSTLGEGINVTRAMIDKCREHAELLPPMLGLRWYANESLEVDEDWIAIPAADWGPVLQAARERDAMADDLQITREDLNTVRETLRGLQEQIEHDRIQAEEQQSTIDELRRNLADTRAQDTQYGAETAAEVSTLLADRDNAVNALKPIQEENLRLARVLEQRENELRKVLRDNEELRAGSQPIPDSPAAGQPAMAMHGTIVLGRHGADGRLNYTGLRVQPGRGPENFTVGTIRIQPDGLNRQQLFVNDQIVRDGQLWIDGILRHQALPEPTAAQQSEVTREEGTVR